MRKTNKAYTLFNDARTRARNKGLDFDLQLEDVILVKRCPVLGIPLRHSSKRRTHNSYSLDRIDNTKGYKKNNILVVSWRANFLKGDASIDELEKIVRFYKRYKNGKANTRRRPKPVLPVLKKTVLEGLPHLSVVGLSKRTKPSNRRKHRLVAVLSRDLTNTARGNKPNRNRNTSRNRVNAKRVSKVKRTTRGHVNRNRTKQSKARASQAVRS